VFEFANSNSRSITGKKCKKMKLILVIKKGKNGYLIGQLKEMPAVFTQGITVEEVKVNILDSLELYLEDIREQYLPEGEMASTS
jgi:predicted RNase H-like HicB family nuclease